MNAAKKPPTLREAARALLDTVNQTCLAHPVPHLSYPIDTLERALAADEARGVCANPYCPHEASAPPAGEPVTCRCVDRATLASSDCQTWDGSVLHSQAGCYEVSAFRAPSAATDPCSCGGYAGEYHRPGEECFPPAAPAQEPLPCQEIAAAGGWPCVLDDGHAGPHTTRAPAVPGPETKEEHHG